MREGNVFTGVRDSVHRGVPAPEGVPAPGGGVPAPGGRGVWSGGGACSQGVPAPGGVCSQGVPALGGSGPGGVPGGDPPTVTAAGGTHPTGMHSCILFHFP